ncbi:GAS2-like protein 2 isoform X2 [Rhinatrema bivittatum]|uniref:GAS2-like protein 2 isoform X2 n=1 Tax=Rhinatrema bivittatum TaxID=194408 RepID=UPI001128BB22|nr:GAS2-like protein 2 isoform X2 [Rhinatrema bivittatum]
MSGIQGASVKSIRPFKSSEQYLLAMKEDLAEWLKDLYALEIGVDSFLEVLETGTVLCQHANNVTLAAQEFSDNYPLLALKLQLPNVGVTFNGSAQPGTFQARDNVSNFIGWCRKEMDIKEVLMFETEDLVLRKNEKHFILCLLELARRASRFGVSAPVLIQMEEEIEEEMREEMDLPPPETPIPKPPRPQRKLCDFKNLDQMVQYLVSRCSCPVQFSMVKVSEGKYRVGDSSTLIFVRILRKHVMVRVGGGWDTLEHYLDKHDPCRCTSLSHKQALKSGSGPKQAAPVHEIKARLMPHPDHSNKPQATLIVSRSQSPLPPVDWRTYTPGSPSWKATSSSPERSVRVAGCRDPLRQSDHHRTDRARGKERSSALLQRQLPGDERTDFQQIASCSSSRDSSRVSVSSETSQLTGSEEETSRASESPRGREEAGLTPVHPSKKELVGKDGVLIQSLRSQVTVPKDSTQLGPKLTAQQGPKLQDSRTQGAASPIKQLYSSPQPCSKGPVQSLKTKQDGIQNHSTVRAPSPVKQVSHLPKPDNQRRLEMKSASGFSRPATPSRSYQDESLARNGYKGPGGDPSSVAVHQKPKTTQSADGLQDQRGCPSVSQERSSPAFQTNTNRLSWPEQGNHSKQSNRACVKECESPKDNSRGGSFPEYTPLPINPEQEKQLYRSLEDEILSNIKVLEGDSDESSSLENHPGDIRSKYRPVSNTAVHNESAFEDSIASASSCPISLMTLAEGVPRSGVYIDTKWQMNGSYDNVIAELSKGHKTLNSVDVESWIAKIPPKELPPSAHEQSSSLPNETKKNKEPLEMEKTYTKRKTVTIETKGLARPRRLPSQRARRAPTEVNRHFIASQTMPDGQKPSNVPPDQAGNLQGFKPKRSLKKPERVPSIYKLKLRPKMRPRKDNRPEKQPSRIPTPVTYRHLKNTANAKGLEKGASSRTSRQQTLTSQGHKNQKKALNTAASVEDTKSEEGITPSKSRVSPRAKSSGREKADDDEESWV